MTVDVGHIYKVQPGINKLGRHTCSVSRNLFSSEAGNVSARSLNSPPAVFLTFADKLHAHFMKHGYSLRSKTKGRHGHQSTDETDDQVEGTSTSTSTSNTGEGAHKTSVTATRALSTRALQPRTPSLAEQRTIHQLQPRCIKQRGLMSTGTHAASSRLPSSAHQLPPRIRYWAHPKQGKRSKKLSDARKPDALHRSYTAKTDRARVRGGAVRVARPHCGASS